MRRHHYIKPALFILLFIAGLSVTVRAQSRPYVKYGSGGETIGLFNLLKDPGRCTDWHVITGNILSVRSQERKEEIRYQLTLKFAGRFRIFAFSIGVDEIPRTDIANLVMKRRGVKVRACEGANFLLVEEITRL
jgi:hypothetical protein